MHTVYTLALISDAFTDTVLPFERKKYGKLMHLDVYIIVHNITYDLKSPEKRRREFFFLFTCWLWQVKHTMYVTP